MSSSIVLYGRSSVVDDCGWGSEALLVGGGGVGGGEPLPIGEMCPRATRLINVLHPDAISTFLHQTMPGPSGRVPDLASEAYWQEVGRVVEAVPPYIEPRYPSPFFDWVKEKVVPKFVKESPLDVVAALERRGPIGLALYAALCPPTGLMYARPWAKSKPLLALVAAVRSNMSAANVKRIVANLVFAVVDYDVSERVEVTRDSLRLPAFIASQGVGDALLLVGALIPNIAKRVYDKYVPRRIRGLTPDEFLARTAVMCSDPILLVSVINRLPARYEGFTFEREFIEAVYSGLDVPEDVGRQALAFGCLRTFDVWRIMRWPNSRTVRQRLSALANRKPTWHVKSREFAEIIYRLIARADVG